MLEVPKDQSTPEVKMSDINTMDNQQETLKLDIWLAGIIDGEGNLSIHINQYKRPSRGQPRPQLIPRIQIGSTSQLNTEKTIRAIKQHTGCLVKDRILPSGKLFQTVHVVGAKRVQTLLPCVLPYLADRKFKAEVIMEFIASRLSKERNVTYTEREWELAHLTHNGPSETTREASSN